MRHRKKRARLLSTGVQKTSNVVRNLLTSLVSEGQLTTTISRARTLKAEADKLFAHLVSLSAKYDAPGAKREADRWVKGLLYTDKAGKKAVNELLPKYLDEGKTTGFVSCIKLGPRPGDAAEEVLVRLV